MFDTYSWATIFSHTMMAQCLEYKFDDHLAMSVTIMNFTVFNFPSKPMSKLKVNVEKFKSLPAHVKFMSNNLTKVKHNHNYTYNMVRKLKDRSS